MKKMIAFFLILSAIVFAQEKSAKYWIYFASKDFPANKPALSKIELKVITGISDRALRRREKVGEEITEEDFPISPKNIQALTQKNIVIENQSRWFNAVTAHLTPEQKKELEHQSSIRAIVPVKTFLSPELPSSEQTIHQHFKKIAGQRFDYGPSLSQMELIDAVKVHNIGISGRGVLVGMLDTGFRWKIHEALQSRRIIAEYDFIQKDSVTENQSGDAGSQDTHGTSTFSLVGGFKEGRLVSPAFNASFILGKTEYVPTETNVEEDRWVAAIEWMEQCGVEVVSSSLGYSEFDLTDANGNPQHSYTYADMNGKTATTTKAAAIAARKGVVVVNAMGNEAGTSWHFLTTPADADSIISVGAVNNNGNYASFSSVGPTSDGRTKPDIVSHGVGTYCAIPSNSSYSGSFQGTSLATPLAAGVAAMILSAHPELTPVQVRDALRNTASNASSPNNTIGWGIIDAYKAILYNGMVISTDPEILMTTDSNYSISMYVVSHANVYKDSVALYYSIDNGKTFSSVAMTETEVVDSTTSSGKYTAIVPGIKVSTNILFYVQAKDNSAPARKSPYGAPTILYDAKTGTTNIDPHQMPPAIPSSFVLEQNFPNPFNPSTRIEYKLPSSELVTLKLYDVLGRKITTLVSEPKSAGEYTYILNAATLNLSSGVYLYQLRAGKFVQTKKMVLIK